MLSKYQIRDHYGKLENTEQAHINKNLGVSGKIDTYFVLF